MIDWWNHGTSITIIIYYIIYVLFVNLFDKESWRWTMNWYNFPYIWNEIKLVWLHRMAVFKCVYFSMLMFFLDYFDSFFVDHNSRQTTWVDPRLNPQVCTTERILSFCVLKIITALFMLWGEVGGGVYCSIIILSCSSVWNLLVAFQQLMPKFSYEYSLW